MQKYSFLSNPYPQLPPKEIPPFGTVFAPYMFLQKWESGKGWYEGTVQPFEHFVLSPAASVFHYGQEIFEGMKVYTQDSGEVTFFRPFENFKRFNRSAERMSMPVVSEADHWEALQVMVSKIREWIPSGVGTALYLRPTMIATEPYLGVRASKEYYHYIIASPVGAYYAKGFSPINVYATDEYRRGVKGGTADVKAGGNYAASIIAAEKAHGQGYDQVLWLDALTGQSVEEVGTSNIFFVDKNKKIMTPTLTGSILPGITRDSIIQLAQHLGLEVEEAVLNINTIMNAISSGDIVEAFGTGTAAVISPIGKIGYKDSEVIINNMETGVITQQLFDELTGIQYGSKNDIFGWVEKLEK